MKTKLFTVIAATSLVLVGCADDNEQGQRYNPNELNDNNAQPVRYNNDPNQMNDFANRNNDNGYTLDRDIEERNNNYYNNNDNYNNNRNNDNFMNTRNRPNNTGQPDRYDVAEQAAEQVANQVEEIERAYVLKTDRIAYVAAQLDTNENGNNRVKNNNNRGDDLTEDVKKQVADAVRSVDNDIEEVYVSTNPDFVNLTNNYVDEANNGEPVEGFFDQMGNMIERLFPQNN